MATFIVRIMDTVVPGFEGELRGTVAKPGEEELPFRSIAQLVAVLRAGPDAGNADGSTANSVMREA